MATIAVDASHAQELVNLWSTKYKVVKNELETLKQTRLQQEVDARAHIQDEKLQHVLDLLRDETRHRQVVDATLSELLVRTERQEATLCPKITELEKDKEELLTRLLRSEARCTLLSREIAVISEQSKALAAEVDRCRRNKITEMFNDDPPVNTDAVSSTLSFSRAQTLIDVLPAGLMNNHRLYFLPRPPSCMPLYVPSIAKSGYWFCPIVPVASEVTFNLIVEGKPGEWTYLGRYISDSLAGYEMRLSEWMMLDEETKRMHCGHASAQIRMQQQQIILTHLDIKRKYDMGDWSIPCYSLHCVGFDMMLYQALHAAVQQMRGAPADTPPSTAQDVTVSRPATASSLASSSAQTGRLLA